MLDNCEHVLDGVSELVHRLAGLCPGLTVLATSRRPLDVAGQQVWLVPPLDVAEVTGTAVQPR